MRGEITAEAVTQITAERTGLPFDMLIKGLEDSCRQMEADTEALELLAELRQKGSKVVIATDNMDTFTRWTVPALGLNDCFDDMLNSYDLRALKSDRQADGTSAFFQDYLRRMPLRHKQAVLVDDGLHNAVVEEFGIRFCKVGPDRTTASALRELLEPE